jgi:signal transduction histidine kinase
MRAFAEIVLDNPDLPPTERERFLRISLEEIERLTRLINQVLDLSKIESGRAEWDIAEVDLRDVIEESAAATAQLLAERRAALRLRMPDRVPPVPADRDRVKQVLLNLLSNAAKFCADERGQVAVELAIEDGAARVDISDNGPGIDPADHELIFDRFRQGAQALGERPSGTGLGLPISREIIRHLGGELWVDSRRGEGSTFSFTLPLTPAPRTGVPDAIVEER